MTVYYYCLMGTQTVCTHISCYNRGAQPVDDLNTGHHQEAVDEAVATGQLTPITATLEDDDPLSEQQRARATAIWEARMALERKGIGGVNPPSVKDLLEVADYILDGRDEFNG